MNYIQESIILVNSPSTLCHEFLGKSVSFCSGWNVVQGRNSEAKHTVLSTHCRNPLIVSSLPDETIDANVVP